MKPLAILNDTHVGPSRIAGTTVTSAAQLRVYATEQVSLLLDSIDTDLAINGDLFDSFSIPLSDALKVLLDFQNWLNKGHKLHLLPGNHDLSNDSSKLSTFQFISQILVAHENVFYYSQGAMLNDGVYAIPHVPNQDLFDLELSRVPKCKYLLVHCNWDNGFAKELDHSLNMSREQAVNLPVEHIIFGHEHSAGSDLGGKVLIVGNQFPVSISDCLDKQDKYRAVLTDEGVQRVKTWDRMAYAEIQWNGEDSVPESAKFVRIVGNATSEEATDALEVVVKVRRNSNAFVVGSGIKIGGKDSLDVTEALASVEDVRAFDVMGMLKEHLTKEQVAVLEKLK